MALSSCRQVIKYRFFQVPVDRSISLKETLKMGKYGIKGMGLDDQAVDKNNKTYLDRYIEQYLPVDALDFENKHTIELSDIYLVTFGHYLVRKDLHGLIERFCSQASLRGAVFAPPMDVLHLAAKYQEQPEGTIVTIYSKYKPRELLISKFSNQRHPHILSAGDGHGKDTWFALTPARRISLPDF